VTSVTVIVVIHNGEAHMPALMESLRLQSRMPDEVIVVDNASTDSGADYLRAEHPWVRIVTLDRNAGFTGGANAGAASASGDVLVTLNDDTVVDREWLAELIQPLEEDSTLGATVSKVFLGPPGSAVIDCAGAEFNAMGFNWGRGANEQDATQFDAAEFVPAVTAVSMAVRASALRGEDLFDDSLFMYYEELDLTMRLRGRGNRIRYQPTSIVHHLRGQSVLRKSNDSWVFQQALANRNRMKIVAKYFPLRAIARNAHRIVLSLMHLNVRLLRARGPRFAAQAASEQIAYFFVGLRERRSLVGLDASLWAPDMQQHSLLGVLRLRRRLGGYEPTR